MRIAILDPFSGISGDMTLGALLGVGLDAGVASRACPTRLGLDDVGVDIREVVRGELVCWKVDFQIPPQPHGRHIAQIRELVARERCARSTCAQKADAAFWAIATAEGEIHGMPPEKVHLHEVGAVDAILDVVGVHLGAWPSWASNEVRCGVLRTRRRHRARGARPASRCPHPPRSSCSRDIGSARDPRAQASSSRRRAPRSCACCPPGRRRSMYTPVRSGFGAGTKDFPGRANALRIILADVSGRSRFRPHEKR